MEFNASAIWSFLKRDDWMDKINHALGPNLTLIHTQGPEHPAHELQPEDSQRLIESAQDRMVTELCEIVKRLYKSGFKTQARQVAGVLETALGDVTSRDVRMIIQEKVQDIKFSP